MPQTMTIREPLFLNVHPNVRNGPVLGHTLELVVPARVSGGLFARRVDSPAFSWWETITFWDLVNGSWIQRGLPRDRSIRLLARIIRLTSGETGFPMPWTTLTGTVPGPRTRLIRKLNS